MFGSVRPGAAHNWRLRALGFTALLWSALGLSTLSCSEQSEGERCDPSNNNDDCGGGLICTNRTLSRGIEGDVCCPERNPTTEVCQRLDLNAVPEPDPVPTATEPQTQPPPLLPEAGVDSGTSSSLDAAVPDAAPGDASSLDAAVDATAADSAP